MRFSFIETSRYEMLMLGGLAWNYPFSGLLWLFMWKSLWSFALLHSLFKMQQWDLPLVPRRESISFLYWETSVPQCRIELVNSFLYFSKAALHLISLYFTFRLLHFSFYEKNPLFHNVYEKINLFTEIREKTDNDFLESCGFVFFYHKLSINY